MRMVVFQQSDHLIEAVASLLRLDFLKTPSPREKEDNVESYTSECLHQPLLVPWAAMDHRYPLLVWV